VRARIPLAILCVAVGSALAAGSAAEERPAPAEATAPSWGYDLARELMSPFCPGSSLADCPSSQAQAMRAWILVQAAAGRSREEVEAELLAHYGDQILAAPRARGFGLTAYAIPIGVFLAGGAVVWAFLRRQTREARAEPRSRAAPLAPDLERLVDEELGR